MSASLRPLLIAACCTLATAFCIPALAAGGGSMSSAPSMPSEPARPATPEELARDAYNAGVSLIRKADDADASASKATDAKKRQKATDKANEYYKKSLGKFETAVAQMPDMYQAWNYIGYAQRHLGNYAEALSAYDRALGLNAGYMEAVEYRGHAYLGLNRLDDARNAYLALFAASRPLAAKLLAGMQGWVAAKRQNAGGVAAATIDGFASWVDERAKIAAQTTALARDGAAPAWR